jgi:hypothetical protein
MKRTAPLFVLLLLIGGVLAACTPPSGETDAVQLTWGQYCSIEVRHGTTTGGDLFVAAHQYGLDANLVPYDQRCALSAVTIKAVGQPAVSCEAIDGWLGTGCTRSPAPLGGEWFQATTPGATVESASVTVANFITDTYHTFQISP